MRKTLVCATAGLLAFSGPASAALVEMALPSNAFVSSGGLDWAWAQPLPASYPGFDIVFQSQFGWRLPTADELLDAPPATDFIFAGANVPLNGRILSAAPVLHIRTARSTATPPARRRTSARPTGTAIGQTGWDSRPGRGPG